VISVRVTFSVTFGGNFCEFAENNNGFYLNYNETEKPKRNETRIYNETF